MPEQAPPPANPTPVEVDPDLQNLLTVANAMLEQLSPANRRVFSALLQHPIDVLNAKLTKPAKPVAAPKTPAK